MIMKNESASDLTIGRLNTIRAFVRTYSIDGQPGKMSKEVWVLPRNSKSGSFSARGDSGSMALVEFPVLSLAETEPRMSVTARL
jgi:hypothetical protein